MWKTKLWNTLVQAFFWTSEKNSSFEKTQANFPKKLKKFSKNSQIRQLLPNLM